MSGCEPPQIRRSDSLSFAILALTADVDGNIKFSLTTPPSQCYNKPVIKGMMFSRGFSPNRFQFKDFKLMTSAIIRRSCRLFCCKFLEPVFIRNVCGFSSIILLQTRQKYAGGLSPGKYFLRRMQQNLPKRHMDTLVKAGS